MSATVHTVETQQSRASAFIQTLLNLLETCGPIYGAYGCLFASSQCGMC